MLRKLAAALVLVFAVSVSAGTVYASVCSTVWTHYGQEYCDDTNGCWWYDGQLEQLLTHYMDCDGDGVYDGYRYEVQEGGCCNL